jgi:hypothetical protein
MNRLIRQVIQSMGLEAQELIWSLFSRFLLRLKKVLRRFIQWLPAITRARDPRSTANMVNKSILNNSNFQLQIW